MKVNRSERNITILLFFIALLVFSLAQEQSRVIENVYSNKWNFQAGTQDTPSKQQKAPIAGPVHITPTIAD